ncbi:hypothetical protein AURANDRAFT_68499 [Aureococcus anophagefferens]|uniref:Uncharacterized protein n=1 Tax=Aureococcus anophagefferens TaxID=44056 RepID=F0YPU9_AURAN|nr:hypothetical protein AURANDRAFT_68499 [Aureococcus anophagefferens]EGB02860.1 hypothetical protein AURANDRAFT_68499 [Aureococcus anophagefferens]|eukprot:XP_009042439.1 hypothetical protein AURANDRAFT_68499 [Aureococcus anophagefferens]
MTWMSYKYFAGNVNHPILMAFAVYLDDFYNYKKLSESTVARFFKMIFPNLVKTAYALFQAKSIRIHNALRDKFQQYQDSGQESCSAVNQDMYEVLNTDCSDYWTHRLEVSLVGRISRIQHALDLCHSDRSTQLLVIHPKITHDLVRCPLLVTNRQFDARLHSPPSFGANEAPARAALPSSAQYFKKKLKLIVIEFIAYVKECVTQSIFAIDVDGDGDVDVFSTSSGDARGEGTIACYENDGSQSFTEHIIMTLVDYAFVVFAINLDGDGDVDALSENYENDGSQFFAERIIKTLAYGAFSVFAIDVDGDGDVDVPSADAGYDTVAWYENDGSQSFTERAITTLADEAYSVFAMSTTTATWTRCRRPTVTTRSPGTRTTGLGGGDNGHRPSVL